MKIECIVIDQIADAMVLPVDEPLRRHIDECPRCGSLAAAYSSFVRADAAGLPVGADTGDADARLMRFLEDQIGAHETPAPEPGSPRSHEGFLARLIAGFAGLPMRPAIAAAASVVVAAIIVWQIQSPDYQDHAILRGAGLLPLIEVLEPHVLAGDSLQIHWEAVEGADGYSFVLFDQKLDAFFRADTGTEATYVLNRQLLPEDAPRVAICRIAALSDGDEIAETAPFPLRLP